jgi:hypothetical protein
MQAKRLVTELEQFVKAHGIKVRYEKGGFRGGWCQLETQDYVVLNRLHPPERHVAILAETIRQYDVPVDTLKPNVLKALKSAWDEYASAVDVEPDDSAA